MSSKKPPPDHTTSALVLPKSTIDEAVIRKAKKRFSIGPDFDLRSRVERACRNYFLVKFAKQKDPPTREQRVLLEEVGTRAKELHDCISRLGYHEQARLGDWPDRLDRLKLELLSLESSIGEALGDLLSYEKQIRDASKKSDLSDRKNKREELRQLFIQAMHAVYKEATHEDRWTTRDLFRDFIKTFLPYIDVEIGDSTLNRDIREALPQKNTQTIGSVKKTDDPIANFISRPLSPKNTS